MKNDTSWNKLDPTLNIELLKERFVETDPTTNNTYLEWIIKSYVDNGIKLLEDLGRTRVALKEYHDLSLKNKLVPEDKDINRFCGIAGCKQKGYDKKGLEDTLEKYKKIQTAGQTQRRIKSTEVNKIYESDNLLVIQPLTENAAKYYGKGTRWCTAAEKDNMFDEYNQDGPLYIIIPKNPSYQREKYQVHEKSSSFMNEKDEELIIYELLNRYPKLEEIKELKICELI